MRYTVPGYVHRPGRHCGSTAMRNVLAFAGVPLSEPMCFGLGSGAGFVYVPRHPVPPGVTIHGRIPDLEGALCASLGIPFPDRPEPDPEAGWSSARAAVLSGSPVLINTDLAHLDYFGTKTHFSGHRIVLVGFDDARGTAIVSDSERPALEELPVASLKASRASDVPPYPMGNRWCVVARRGPLRPLREAIPAALSRNARWMLDAPEGPLTGLPGMRRAASDMPSWPRMTENWTFAARFGYQVIEKRGTGGGFFRRLYADYLDEAAERCPAVAGLGGALRIVADGWSALAKLLKEIAESGDAPRLAAAAELLAVQADAEERFWKTASAAAEGATPPCS